MTETASFGYQRTLEEGLARIVAGTLGAPDASDRLEALLDEAARLADGMIADMETREPPPRPLACAGGCDHCCVMFEVHVLPLEALRIAALVAAAFDGRQRQDLVRRTRQVLDGKKQGGEERFPCPLLRDGLCAVYQVRPMTCRGFNSYDAETCRLGANIEGYVHPQRIAQYTLAGFRRGFAEAGLDTDFLDLAPALAIALDDSDAKRRWLAGEPVFARARSRTAKPLAD